MEYKPLSEYKNGERVWVRVRNSEGKEMWVLGLRDGYDWIGFQEWGEHACYDTFEDYNWTPIGWMPCETPDQVDARIALLERALEKCNEAVNAFANHDRGSAAGKYDAGYWIAEAEADKNS